MSRNKQSAKRKPRQRPAEALTAGNLDSVETQAAASLSAERYKDATVAYKALLKVEQRASWVTGLAQAYAGRAAELAGKGMFQEALTIWEQRATSCKLQRSSPIVVIWQLQAGHIDAALEQYLALSAELPIGEIGPVREYLAAAALAGESRIVENLPADDPVARDQPVADTLLLAFCQGDESGIDAALKGISHRSPFRDFRQVIKAWVQGEKSPADVAATLSRIPLQSPFRGLANTLLKLHSGENGTAVAVHVDSDMLALQTALHGWSGKQVELLKAAVALGPEPNAKALFNLLVRFAQVFDPNDARATALKLLVHYPHGQQGFNKAFGQLSDLEEAKLEAQLEELSGEPPGLESSWRDVVFELENLSSTRLSSGLSPGLSAELPAGHTGGPSGEPASRESTDSSSVDNSLRAALVLRRLASQILAYQKDAYTRSIAIEDLSASLALDADCAATHVRLVELFRMSNQLKFARHHIDEALRHFPKHTGVLLEAVQTAIAGKAFKKAAGLARQLLKIDPINVKVQAMLLDAHMAHARKQIAGGKYDLARRELDEAATWSRSSESEGQVLLLRGMLECEAGKTVQGRTLLQQGVELSGGALVGQFRLLVEGERLQAWSGTEWLALAKLPKPIKFALREPVLALVRAVADTREASKDLLTEALEPFEPALRKACKLPFTQTEMLQVCETLYRADQFELLEKYATRARKQWPLRAVFGFHYLYARCEGWFHELDEHDLDQLDLILDAAHIEGDDRTVHRMMEFVYPPDPFGIPEKIPEGIPGSMPKGFPGGFPPGVAGDSINGRAGGRSGGRARGRTSGRPGDFPAGMPPGFAENLAAAFADGVPEGLPAALLQMIEELGPEGVEAMLEAMEGEFIDPSTGSPLASAPLPGGHRKPKPRASHGGSANSGSRQGASKKTAARQSVGNKTGARKSDAKKPMPNPDQGELF